MHPEFRRPYGDVRSATALSALRLFLALAP
jgi:hypothetical protein